MRIRLFAVLPALLATPAAAVNLVQNGSFEEGFFLGWQGVGGQAPNTHVTDDPTPGPSDGRYYAVFDSALPRGIRQVVETQPGATYTLSFDLANLGGAPNGWRLQWGDRALDLRANLPPFGWTRFDYTVVGAATPQRLDFVFTTTNARFALDNVSLTRNGFGSAPPPSPIPEPGSWALMILGFGVVGGALRRRAPAPAA